MNKIVITGGSGFIGSNLINFYNKKEYDVYNIDFEPPQNGYEKEKWKNVDLRDYDKLKETLNKINPDFILHFAARTDLNGKSLSDYDSNILGTANLIKATRELSNLKKVIFTSSMLVHRPGSTSIEGHKYNPTTTYGMSKVKMEQIILKSNHSYEWAIVRPTSIWGPGFKEPYRNFFDMIRAKKYFHIGGKVGTKTYGYIGNVLYQIDCILGSPSISFHGKIFYLGDYIPTIIRDWANEIGERNGQKLKTIPYPIIKVVAVGGDILKKIGVNFPITTFRLKNMTTPNVVDLTETQKIAPNLPYTRRDGIEQTLIWLKKRI